MMKLGKGFWLFKIVCNIPKKEILYFIKGFLFLVVTSGIEPLFEAYETPALPLNYVTIIWLVY